MSKNEFKMPVGRLQKVMSDVNYGKVEKFKVEDYFNQRLNKNPRYVKKEEDSLKGCKNTPYHHNDIKNLLNGTEKKNYKKEDIFETKISKLVRSQKCPKGKKICDCHKKQSKKLNKKPIKSYKNEFHTLY